MSSLHIREFLELPLLLNLEEENVFVHKYITEEEMMEKLSAGAIIGCCSDFFFQVYFVTNNYREYIVEKI